MKASLSDGYHRGPFEIDTDTRGDPGMSVRDRYGPIALAAVAFTATVAVLWHRQTADAPSTPSHTQARAQSLAAISAFRPVNTASPAPQEQPGSLGNFAPTRVASPAQSETPAVSTSPSEDDADGEVPVTMNFRHARGREAIEGGLANLAEHALEITATLRAGTREQEIEFTVDAGTGHRIGVDDGLEIHSGDQITVHSPPFRDRVFPVP